MKIDIKKVPNILSALRVLSVPLVVLLLKWDFPGHFWAAAILFVLSSVTDMLDGQIARKYDCVTNVGKFIDPIADKLMTTTVMIWVAVDSYDKLWVMILVMIMIAREFVISAFRLLAVSASGTVIAAAWPGKIKTLFQYIALCSYMLKDSLGPLNGFCYVVFVITFIISAVMSVYSCADYIWSGRNVLKG